MDIAYTQLEPSGMYKGGFLTDNLSFSCCEMFTEQEVIDWINRYTTNPHFMRYDIYRKVFFRLIKREGIFI